MKKYIKYSFVFLILGLCFGVFFREYTKFMGLEEVKYLSLVHPHFLVLGVILTLVIGLVQNQVKVESKLYDISFKTYSLGVLLTGLMLFVRGLLDSLVMLNKLEISKGLDGAISGIAGLSHIVLGVSVILIFVAFIKSFKRERA